MARNKSFEQKRLLLAELGNLLEPGNRVFVSSGPATPVRTLEYLLTSPHDNLVDLEFVQLARLGSPFSEGSEAQRRYKVRTFAVGENIGQAFRDRDVDYIPTNLAELPYLFVSGAVGVDVAIIQTSLPDSRGRVNLGVVNDIPHFVIEKAPLVIAEINPHVPRTFGTTAVSLKQFDHIVESDRPLLEFRTEPYDSVLSRIGWHVSHLIEDGATLSFGAGRVFDAIASHLGNKRNLSVCSHIVSDWVINLGASGAVVRQKSIHKNAPVVATAYIGTRNLYDYTHENPTVAVKSLLQAREQAILPSLKKLTSVINVDKIDLSGDSVLVPRSEYQVAGFDGKLNFALAATNSRDGKAIVALRSVARDGSSNIVLRHGQEDGNVRSTLGSTRYVVTEYGVANTFGKTIRERALALIEIAHPSHREQLISEAKRDGILYGDRVYVMEHAVNYPFDLELERSFKRRLQILFRPIKASDEGMMRRLFYRCSAEARVRRYFSLVRTMTHRKMQAYVNVDYKKTLSMVGVIQHRGVERIVAECRYAYEPEQKAYEMAFLVEEAYQGRGIGSFMVDYLLEIAGRRKIEKLVAHVLPENRPMIRILKQARIPPREVAAQGEIQYFFYLDAEQDLLESLSWM